FLDSRFAPTRRPIAHNYDPAGTAHRDASLESCSRSLCAAHRTNCVSCETLAFLTVADVEYSEGQIRGLQGEQSERRQAGDIQDIKPEALTPAGRSSVGGAAGDALVCYFVVDRENPLHRTRPRKTLSLIVAALLHAGAKDRIEQR